MNIVSLVQICIGTILINNFVLAKFLGLCPFFGVSKKLSSALGMGLAVIFVMTIASLFTYLLNTMFLIEGSVFFPGKDLSFLQTVTFILVIASLVQLVEMVLRKYSPTLYEALGIYLPLITTNCAILGVAVLNTKMNIHTAQPYTFIEAVVNGAASGVGFTLALVLMAGVRERLELSRVPRPLEGLPIAFISAGLIALAFFGFKGLTFFS